ncbi:RHS repeat-associated core domain-containing protein [Treponema pedis]|uniref:RHS repeat-associated core domain-containing protein n=1 Tax=Treponema pedis TaxID=409322 RepID=UPI003D241140
MIEPDGNFTQMGYYHPTNRHLMTEATDAHGGKWQWIYDKNGNLLSRKNPLGAETQFKYESGLLHIITDALGSQTEIAYDDSKNIVRIQSPNNALTKYGYDRLGQCVQVTNPNDIHQNRQLDLLGRVTTVYDFDNNTIELEYDAMDNITRYKDHNKEVHYSYKGLNKLMSRRDSAGTVRYRYDTEGQLREITNQAGERYSFELDGRGDVIKEKGFDGIVRLYERDEAGRVIKIQRPGKRHTQYEYDPAGHITRVDYHDGSEERFWYEKGLLKAARNADSIVEFERDAMGNILKETCNGHEITSRYDILGRRTHTASSLGADISMELDSLSNVTSIETQGWQAKIDYDRQGLEIQRSLSGGLTAQTRRDKTGRVRYQNAVINGQTTHLHREYQWGIDDRLAKIIDLKTNETTAFEYNDRGFLTRAVYGGKEEVWRTADKLGNLYESPDFTDRIYYNSRLEHDSKRSWYYYYDSEGNLILKSPFHRQGKKPDTSWGICCYSYEWNANGSLKSVTTPSTGKKIFFKYDAFGRRIGKSYGNREFLYIWDKNVLLHEIKKEGKQEDEITTWVFEGFTPTAKLVNGKSYSIISDYLGTPLQAIDSEGKLIWERELDIYGRIRKETKKTANFVPMLYQGQYLDIETDLCYNRHRYYDPSTGCYISQDPIGLAGNNPTLYGYVKDPNTWVDVFGLDCENITPRKANNLEGGPLENATQVSGRFPLENGPINGTLFRADNQDNVTSYAVYDDKGMIMKRVDVTGAAHRGVPTPHVIEYGRNTYTDSDGNTITRVQSPDTKARPRPATKEEIP